MKDITSTTKDEFIQFVNSFDYVFFDVDGVLQLSRITLPGSDLCVKNLRKLGKKISIVSNNSVLPKKMSVALLQDFEVTEDEVTTSSEPVANYLKRINFQKDIFLISGENTKNILKAEGFNVVQKEPSKIEDSMSALKKDYEDTLKEFPNVGAVVIDPDANVSTVKVNRAVSLLNHNTDAIFLYGAFDEEMPLSKKIIIFGPKFPIDTIKHLTNREGLSYAKPSKLLANDLNDKYNVVDPKKVLFVGDNLNVDVAFSALAGYQSLLVLSGQTHKEEIIHLETQHHVKIRPDFYTKNLNEFNDLLIKYFF